ncbi:MAG: hypothetical protein COV75_06765 [Candidatus Omnitrophica bacterium CG11_big_fil_rev_8_21_14_0_20_63_9]|nr:MAG: hypothetical protein COV75_06765 [Candidatus Omnitrophica bacterium CG11_big_fil_rev_8_21_14_0_20_63_9]
MMRKGYVRWVVGFLVAGTAMPCLAESGVDLVVSDVVASAVAPKILVVIRNQGTKALTKNVSVELRMDDMVIGAQEITDTIKSGPNPLYVEFPRPEQLAPGLHYLSARIDPDESIKEVSKANNMKGISVWVNGNQEGGRAR